MFTDRKEFDNWCYGWTELLAKAQTPADVFEALLACYSHTVDAEHGIYNISEFQELNLEPWRKRWDEVGGEG